MAGHINQEDAVVAGLTIDSLGTPGPRPIHNGGTLGRFTCVWGDVFGGKRKKHDLDMGQKKEPQETDD